MNQDEVASLSGNVRIEGLEKAIGELKAFDAAMLASGGVASKAAGQVSKAQSQNAAAMEAAVARQKRSLSQLKTAAVIGGGVLAAAGAATIGYGIKLNAQWESQQASFQTFLGSQKKALAFTDRLREVSSKSPLKLTDYAESAKLLLGFGMSAKKIVPTLKAVNKAIVASGKGSEEMNRVVQALGKIQATGKITGETLMSLAEIGVPVQKILQRELGLTGEQIGNIGEQSIPAGKAIAAIASGWNKQFGKAYKNSSKTFNFQLAGMKKSLEQLLRITTFPLFDKLRSDVLPAVNEQIGKFIEIVDNPKLTGAQKFKRVESQFYKMAGSIGELAENALPGLERAFVGAIPAIQKAVEKLTPVFANVLGELAAKAIPAAVILGGKVATSFFRGFTDSNIWGKLLIGTFLMSKLGGFAAIKAAGAAAGAQYSAGFAATGSSGVVAATASGGAGATAGKVGAGFSATNAGATGAAAGAAATATKLGKIGAVAGAVAKKIGLIGAALVAVDVAMTAFSTKGDGWNKLNASAEKYLNTISLGHGKEIADFFGDSQETRMEKVAGSIHKVVNGTRYWSDGMTHVASSAKDYLKLANVIIPKLVAEGKLTEDIGNAEAARARAKAKQLNIGDRINTGSEHLRGGDLVGPDIQKFTDKQLKMISRSYNKYTPQWRGAVWQTLKAQEAAIRRTWTKNGHITQRGLEKIKEIQQRRKNMLAGADPLGLAKGIVNGWRKAKKANQINMGRMISQLKEMPPKARVQAANVMLRYSKELEARGKLPEGTVKRLKSKILTQFGPRLYASMKGQASNGWDQLSRTYGRGADKATKALDKVASRAEKTKRRTTVAFKGMQEPVRTAMTGMANDANSYAASFGSKEKVSLSFRRGGKHQHGRLVPAMVSSGEMIEYRGKRMIVPGKRTNRDNVHTELPPGATVWTDHGQQLLAQGVPKGKALREQMPHFGSGGEVTANGKLRRPQLVGGAPAATPTGNAALKTARLIALKWMKKHEATNTGQIRNYKGVRMADWVIGALEYAAKKGANPQPTSGYRSHAENVAQGRYYTSEHEGTKYGQRPGGAVDFGGFTSGYDAKMSVVRATSDYKYPLLAPIEFRDDGHASGTGHSTGGRVRDITDALLKRGYSAKAAAGIVGNAYREAGPDLNPGSVGTGGGGLFGFTAGAISLANLQRAAAAKGKDWTDIDFQVGFMDAHMPADLKARLNQSGSVYDATKLFMDEWERPGIPAFEDRLAGANMAWAALQDRRNIKVKKAKHQLGSVKKLWHKIKAKGTTKSGKKRATLAGSHARAALKAARNYDFDTATSEIGKVGGFRKKAYHDIHKKQVQKRRAAQKDNKPKGKGHWAPSGGVMPNGKGGRVWIPDKKDTTNTPPPGVAASSYDPSKPFSATNYPGMTDKGTLGLLGGPGLTIDEKETILSGALDAAGRTDTNLDDAAVYGAQLTLGKTKLAGARATVKKDNSLISKLGGKPQVAAWTKKIKANAKKQRDLEKKIGKLPYSAKTKAGKKALLKKRQALTKQLRGLRKHGANLAQKKKNLTGLIEERNTGLSDIAAAQSGITSANTGLADLNTSTSEDTTTSDLVTAMKELTDALNEQNALAAKTQGIAGGEIGRAVKDWLSGELVGKGIGFGGNVNNNLRY